MSAIPLRPAPRLGPAGRTRVAAREATSGPRRCHARLGQRIDFGGQVARGWVEVFDEHGHRVLLAGECLPEQCTVIDRSPLARLALSRG